MLENYHKCHNILKRLLNHRIVVVFIQSFNICLTVTRPLCQACILKTGLLSIFNKEFNHSFCSLICCSQRFNICLTVTRPLCQACILKTGLLSIFNKEFNHSFCSLICSIVVGFVKEKSFQACSTSCQKLGLMNFSTSHAHRFTCQILSPKFGISKQKKVS